MKFSVEQAVEMLLAHGAQVTETRVRELASDTHGLGCGCPLCGVVVRPRIEHARSMATWYAADDRAGQRGV